MSKILRKNEILGVEITNALEEEILEYVVSFLEDGTKKGYIVTPNPEIIMYAQAHPEYREILNKADVALCDGVGLSLAALILGNRLSGRVTGVDMVEKICKESVRKGFVVGFLGSGRGVALKTSECLGRKYPGLKVGFIGDEWSDEGFEVKDLVLKESNENTGITGSSFSPMRHSQKIDMLFVAFGFPKQEVWISENLGKVPVKMAMGVGGAFDYISGAVPRAPFVMRAVGMEWLFRLIVQPWRAKRQIRLLAFVKLVIQERMRLKK